MPGLALANVSLSDYPSGANEVIFDVDPESYNPFSVPIRGSSMKTLDGGVLHQTFGLKQADFVIQMSGTMTEYATVQAIWSKYIAGGTGQQFIWRDWYQNKFQVIFTPGQDAYHPVPIRGACTAHTFSLSLTVISVIEWFSGAYG